MNAKPKSLPAAACALAAMLALAGSAGAAQEQEQASGDAPAPPAIPEGGSGQEGQPSEAPPPPTRVQRRTEHGQTITEYYRGGKVFLMTVKPRVGPTQYWDDPDGDGQFQPRTSDNIDESLNLPKWKIGSW